MKTFFKFGNKRCHSDMGRVPQVTGHNCLQKLEKDFCEKIARFGGSAKRLRAKTGLSFCGLSTPPKP